LAKCWPKETARQLKAEKAKLARLDAVIGAPERIAAVAADLAEHIDRRFEGMGGGKVMIVGGETPDRCRAV